MISDFPAGSKLLQRKLSSFMNIGENKLRDQKKRKIEASEFYSKTKGQEPSQKSNECFHDGKSKVSGKSHFSVQSVYEAKQLQRLCYVKGKKVSRKGAGIQDCTLPSVAVTPLDLPSFKKGVSHVGNVASENKFRAITSCSTAAPSLKTTVSSIHRSDLGFSSSLGVTYVSSRVEIGKTSLISSNATKLPYLPNGDAAPPIPRQGGARLKKRQAEKLPLSNVKKITLGLPKKKAAEADPVLSTLDKVESENIPVKEQKDEVTYKEKGIVIGTVELLDDGYIVTPGKHKIHINSFLMEQDRLARQKLTSHQPDVAAMANYTQDIYTNWREMEKKINRKTFQLSFHPGSDIEKFRQMALYCIFQYVKECDLSGSVTHCSVHNLHRVLFYYTHEAKAKLTANLFIGTIAACLRMALKHEETPEKVRPLREAPQDLWKRLGFGNSMLQITKTCLNKIEIDCFNILNNPLTPPSAPDYLDRYLTVGGWPDSLIQKYREMALYLVSLALFSRRDTDFLAGIPPSLIAASALALGIKVITAGNKDGYEFWPERLEVYSGYRIPDLKAGVRGLSSLLRFKPAGSEILEHFHPMWARYDWK